MLCEGLLSIILRRGVVSGARPSTLGGRISGRLRTERGIWCELAAELAWELACELAAEYSSKWNWSSGYSCITLVFSDLGVFPGNWSSGYIIAPHFENFNYCLVKLNFLFKKFNFTKQKLDVVRSGGVLLGPGGLFLGPGIAHREVFLGPGNSSQAWV